MPDNQPEKSPEFPTMNQAFWAAQNADPIVAHLLKEEGQSWKIAFHNAEAIERCSMILGHRKTMRETVPPPSLAALVSKWNITPILSAFFDLTYPVDKPEQRKVSVMNWIAERYLTETHNDEQILAEDLYKIGEDVRYFNRLRSGGHIKGKTVEDHKTLDDLRETLKPFADKRAKKKTESLERHMGADTRNEIMAGTTILHQSDRGRIVMVHTIKASQYWGNNTKWCVSGEDTADDFFPDYNGKGAIIMFLPKSGQKEALVKRQFWVPEDRSFNTTSPKQIRLIDEMLAANPDWARYFQDEFLPLPPAAAKNKDNKHPVQKVFESVSRNIQGLGQKKPRFPAWKTRMIKEIQNNTADWRYDDKYFKDARKDKDIVLAAVTKFGPYLEQADISLRRDKDVILAAIKEQPSSVYYVDKEIWKDRLFALELIRANPHVLSYVPYGLQEDEEFVLSAIEIDVRAIAGLHLLNNRSFALKVMNRNPEALEFLPEKFRSNPHFIAKVLSSNPDLALHLPKCRNIAMPADDIVLAAQMIVLDRLLQNGQQEEAHNFLRFIKPLWGDAGRVLGKPAEQLVWLKKAYPTTIAQPVPGTPEMKVA